MGLTVTVCERFMRRVPLMGGRTSGATGLGASMLRRADVSDTRSDVSDARSRPPSEMRGGEPSMPLERLVAGLGVAMLPMLRFTAVASEARV